MSSQEAMSPSHTFMVMDQDGLWSWELSCQEKLYQGIREGKKDGIRRKERREGRRKGGREEGREGGRTYELSD